MEKFESQFEDLDVQSSYMENAMGSTSAVSTPQEQVDLLMQKIADEAGLEMTATLNSANTETPQKITSTEVEKNMLGERFKALRN